MMRWGTSIVIAIFACCAGGTLSAQTSELSTDQKSDFGDRKFDIFKNKNAEFSKEFSTSTSSDFQNKMFSTKNSDLSSKKFSTSDSIYSNKDNWSGSKMYNIKRGETSWAAKKFETSSANEGKKMYQDVKDAPENQKMYAGDLPLPIRKLIARKKSETEQAENEAQTVAESGVLTEKQVKERLNKNE